MAEIRGLYRACVESADHHFGEVLSILREAGQWQNTEIIFLSDHGEEFFDHGDLGHGQSLYAELTRVPLLWKPQDSGPQSMRHDGFVSLTQVAPTLLERLGLSSALDAAAATPFSWRHPPTATTMPWIDSRRLDFIKLIQRNGRPIGSTMLSIRHGDWRLIWDLEQDHSELYNLRTDPVEAQDASHEQPLLVQRLRNFAGQDADQLRRLRQAMLEAAGRYRAGRRNAPAIAATWLF